MSGAFNEDQMARLAQYRRSKKALDSSVSDVGGVAGEESNRQEKSTAQQTGQPRGVEWSRFFGSIPTIGTAEAAPRAPSVASVGVSNNSSRAAAPSRGKPTLGGGVSTTTAAAAAINNNATTHAAAASSNAISSAIAAGAAVPADLATYILDLERQNQELRTHIQFLQEALLHSPESTQQMARELLESGQYLSSNSGGFVPPNSSSRILSSQVEKEAFLNEVMAQVDIVIQAYRNKMSVEVQRYKTEAQQAQSALRQLRDSIHQEGMDLSLAPSMVLMQKKYNQALGQVLSSQASPSRSDAAAGGGAADQVAIHLSPKVHELLHAVGEDILSRLSLIQEGDDVQKTVHDAVAVSFQAIVAHFTTQLANSVEECTAVSDELRRELASSRDEYAKQLAASENQRVNIVQHYEQHVQALRDELHAFHVASTQDNVVQATVQERALDEYTSMLVDARTEAANLRRELEDEKNHSAQVCLKLKSSLQKRNSEFEQAIVARAEELLKGKQKEIDELRLTLQQSKMGGGRNSLFPTSVEEKSVQAGDGHIVVASAKTFIPNLINIASTIRSSAGAGGGSGTPVLTSPITQQQQHSMRFEDSATGAAANGGSSTTHNDAVVYEQQVLRKTQELLGRYGVGLNQSSVSSLSGTRTPAKTLLMTTPARGNN